MTKKNNSQPPSSPRIRHLHIEGYNGKIYIDNSAPEYYALDILRGETIPPNNTIKYRISFSEGEAYSLDMVGDEDLNTKFPAYISINFIDDEIYNKSFFGTIEKIKGYEQIGRDLLPTPPVYCIEINVKKSDSHKYLSILSADNIYISSSGKIWEDSSKGIVESFKLCNIQPAPLYSKEKLTEILDNLATIDIPLPEKTTIFQESMQLHQKELINTINHLRNYILLIAILLLAIICK